MTREDAAIAVVLRLVSAAGKGMTQQTSVEWEEKIAAVKEEGFPGEEGGQKAAIKGLHTAC